MIIDAHTHAYPQELAQDPAAWARARGEAHWSELVAPKGRRSLQDFPTTERMLADMDHAGVGKAVLLGWYWERPETCAWHNAFMLDLKNKHPERFEVFATVHAGAGAHALDELKRAHQAGACGVGEVHLGVQGVTMRDAHWLAVVEYACEHHLPINFHVTEPVGRPHAGRIDTPFEDFLWLATQYPDLKIILAHCGGLLGFYELNPYVKQRFANVFYDTAALPLLYEASTLPKLIDTVGAHKVLYGSDYPLRVYPKTQQNADFLSFTQQIAKSLNTGDYDAVMGQSCQKLLP